MTFAHDHFAVRLPVDVELSCKKLYNVGGCQAYATAPMQTMDPDLVDAQICEGGTQSTNFFVVATKRPTQAFLPYPGRNPTPITPKDMMSMWTTCKDATISDARDVNVDGTPAGDFDLTTPMGPAKGRSFTSDEYSILGMAIPKAAGVKPEEISAFITSLHPGPGPKGK